MLLDTLFPMLPETPLAMMIVALAIVGTILVIYSQFVEAENWRDVIRMSGAFFLMLYALTTHNVFFIITFFGIFIAALIELIEILMGIHTHDKKDVDTYKHIGKQ